MGSQELLNKQLMFCQMTIALSIIRIEGVFLIKIFDCYLSHTCAFLYLVKNLFNSFALTKPNQSRPANSERYCVYNRFKEWSCKKKKRIFIERLLHLNNRINELKETDEMITPSLPLRKIEF